MLSGAEDALVLRLTVGSLSYEPRELSSQTDASPPTPALELISDELL